MPEKYILIAIVMFIVIAIFIAIVVITIKNSKTIIETKIVNVSDERETKAVTIKDMTEIAANRHSTQEDLKKAVDIVIKELPFPKKVKFKLPKDVKIYLNFVLLIASHKNADAKLIAYMDEKLKEANMQYGTEIDIYENEGFKERKNRI